MIKEIEATPGAIMFIDEIHTVIGAGATSGGAMDASNLLKPALASGTLRCIGSTTYKEYRQYFEKDRALVRRFQKIDVNEPSVPDAIEILKGLKPYFEEYHKLKYTNEAIKAAVELSARYIHDRKLPDKAIDVIDESGAAQMLLPDSRRKKTIGIKEVETTIATMARIPPKTVSKDDAEVLQHLENTLKTVVYGQDKAVESLSASIKLARAGLREPEKPIGSYLFSGPTGVGKTEVAKQLASSLGVELIRFDMSEYMERHTVSRLIGAPPGYVGFDQGGLLTDSVDQHPHCVLLLDEIEKAHPDLFNVLLQIMDHGRLTDHNGKQVSFRNVILIMTTNAGAADLAKGTYGFTRNKREGDDIEAINKLFAPEFRNRLDAVITFAHLSEEVISKVVEKFVMQLEAQLADRNVTIELSDEASRWLIANGYDELMGARPMARVIQENIKKPLADEVLFGKLKDGGHVKVVVLKGETGRDEIGFEYARGPGHAEAGEATGGAREGEAQAVRSASRSRRLRAVRAGPVGPTRPAAARCRRCRWSRRRRRSHDCKRPGLSPAFFVCGIALAPDQCCGQRRPAACPRHFSEMQHGQDHRRDRRRRTPPPSASPSIATSSDDPVWAPIFEAYKPIQHWLADKKPDVLFMIYNDHVTSFFFDHYSAFALGIGDRYAVADEGGGARALPPVRGHAGAVAPHRRVR